MLRMCASALGIYDLNCPSLRRMAVALSVSRRSELAKQDAASELLLSQAQWIYGSDLNLRLVE